jgi:hypothetical protein
LAGLDSTVTSVLLANSTGVAVRPGGSSVDLVLWFANTNLEEFLTQGLGGTGIESHLVDSITDPTIQDSIFANPTVDGAGDPNFFVAASTFQLGNQGFLDVLLFF